VTPARKALFAAVPTVALLGLGECTARIAGCECTAIIPDATGWEQMIGDPRYLWKLEPDRLFESPAGNTQINSVGLRSPYLPNAPPQSGELRVLITGDSSVYGWGQPEGKTYAEQLEAMLSDALIGRPVKVINLGVPGFSTEQTLRLLADVGWAYEPHLVVVHNIFSDCNIDAFQDRDAMALADPEGTPLKAALHSSALYCAMYMPWAGYSSTRNQETNRVLMPGIPTGPNAARALEVIDQVIDLSRVPLNDYLGNLAEIKAQAESRGAQMLLAPLAQEWDVGVWNVPMDPPTEDQVLPWMPYRDAQEAWAEDNDVERVYLPDAFAAAPGAPERLFIDNMHPSVTGAGVMAQAITERLRANPELLGLTAADINPRWSAPELPEQVGMTTGGGIHGGGAPPGAGMGPPGPPPGGGAGPQGPPPDQHGGQHSGQHGGQRSGQQGGQRGNQPANQPGGGPPGGSQPGKMGPPGPPPGGGKSPGPPGPPPGGR